MVTVVVTVNVDRVPIVYWGRCGVDGGDNGSNGGGEGVVGVLVVRAWRQCGCCVAAVETRRGDGCSGDTAWWQW